MEYAITQILEFTKGRLLQNEQPNQMLRNILIDSRQIISAKDSIFIPLEGRQSDGHDYLRDAYAEGVRCFIISKKEKAKNLLAANIIEVENTLIALQSIAAQHRQQFSYPVIGITGSNGKTMTKEWLFQLLQEDHYVVRSPKSYNSQLGVPISVWNMNKHHQIAIFEGGISQVGEMDVLAKIIRPTIGILTSIGAAHDEGFSSRTEKLKEKLKLFQGAKFIVSDYKISQKSKEYTTVKFCTWGREKEADLQLTRVVKRPNGTQIYTWWQGEKVSILAPFHDAASLENVMHCWRTLLELGYDTEEIKQRLLKLERVAMRLELIQGNNGCLLINDSYNSDLTSLKIALRFLAQQGKNLTHTLVLSDILQSGQQTEELYRDVAQLIDQYEVEHFIGIGKEIVALKTYLPKKIKTDFYGTTDELLRVFDANSLTNAIILLKGARDFTFEKLAVRLAQKSHNTVLEVNLNALIHNLKVYRTYLKPATKLLVMVKAFAYGSGSLEIAKILEYQKVDYLGVAYVDEGVELRKNGIKAPILVLNAELGTFSRLLEYQLEPEIYSLFQLRELALFMQNVEGEIGIHLKLETGMNRLGFDEQDLTELCAILQENERIKVLSTFSHLAGSDEPKHDNYSQQQVERFNKSYTQLCSQLGYSPFRHILNSSGIVRFPDYQMEMVRLGIGLHGVGTNADLSSKLRVVNTLKTHISQIKKLNTGDTVGYGRYGEVTRSTRSATLSIGYADGLLRAAGRGNFSVFLHGKRAPIVGNICMDMCMIDITEIAEAKEGDEVIIFGEQPRAEELAKAIETIPYEVFTNISQRVNRVYVEE